MNKLIRQYYPKNQETNKCNAKNINEIHMKLNRRPRKGLNYEKPINIFGKFVTRKIAFGG